MKTLAAPLVCVVILASPCGCGIHDGPPHTNEDTTEATGTVTSSDAVVRIGPGEEHPPTFVLKPLESGTTVDILARTATGEWSAVSVGSWFGWLATSFLRDTGLTSNLPIVGDINELRLSGIVIDSQGVPVSGTTIEVYTRQPRTLLSLVDGAADGTFYCYVPTEGIWDVEINALNCGSHIFDSRCALDGYFPMYTRTQIHIPQTEELSFVIQKTPDVLTGTVVDEDGRPVTGVSVIAERGDGAYSFSGTSATGEFQIPCSDGLWEVFARNYSAHGTDLLDGPHITVQCSADEPSLPIVITAP
jgi:uncharacterized protein YraI